MMGFSGFCDGDMSNAEAQPASDFLLSPFSPRELFKRDLRLEKKEGQNQKGQ